MKKYKKKVINPVQDDIVMKMEEEDGDVKDYSLRSKVVHFNQ